MSWSYGGNPAGNRKDGVRFFLGDTVTTNQQVTDEEISFALERKGSLEAAGAMCADALAAKYAVEVSTSVGPAKDECQQKFDHFRKLASDLRSSSPVLPSFGGQSVSDKRALAADSDAVQPAFEREMTDNPQAPARYLNSDLGDERTD